ncbi:hypothetical protein [Sphingomonas sp. AX6]|uniref:hypothetical protein n=1 Tax=Sphingomonas sp. AX6 TaxID=2653171 RepID=UPI00135BDE26|nr:hypothetical protein [Sphingomonas sp. AX6]
MAVAFGLIALMIHTGDPSSSSWWLAAIPFALWIVCPAVAAYLLARRRRDRITSIAMLAFLVISTALSGAAYYQAIFVSESSTAALVFLFVPLYQWTAFLVVAGVILAVTSLAKRR